MNAAERPLLIEAALRVRHAAYPPYSRFLVGAAVWTESGQLFVGCNVENASYGLTICAERAALFTAVSAGHRRFQALALATEGGHTPCGACLQVLHEFATDLPLWIIDVGDPRAVRQLTLGQLLPQGFGRSTPSPNGATSMGH